MTRLVPMTEWDRSTVKDVSFAKDLPARRLVEALRDRVDIREGYEGLEINSTSFVGRVDIGGIRVAIRPKLPAMPLGRLLRYAYGLRDVTTVEETISPTEQRSFHDLLIALLATEVEELLHRGLARRYVPLLGKLESPRGQILIDWVVREGGVREARLPCRHVERRSDWHLNQVLRAGLDMSRLMTTDRMLQRRVHQLSDMFGDVSRLARLHTADIDLAERQLTRLTDASRSALAIIRLLHDSLGTAFDAAPSSSAIPGFLFDMNVFFQRLISRFLHDNLTKWRVADEWAIRNLFVLSADANPRQRRTPAPTTGLRALRR